MLNEKVKELLNSQIEREMYSAYIYLDISNYFLDQGLDGFSNWYNVQAKEEMSHAMLIMKYLQNNGESINLKTIEAPNHEFSELIEPLLLSDKHEHYVTSLINDIYTAAREVNDYRSMQFLDWFIKEQGEEEKNSDDLIKKFKLFGSDPKGLYMLDTELASRVYSDPSLVL